MSPVDRFVQICKFLGLSPFSTNPRTQCALYAYTWLTVSALILNVLFGITLNYYGDGYFLSSLAVNIVFCTIIFAHIVTIIESLYTRNQQQILFVKLQEFDELFHFKLRYKIPVIQIERRVMQKHYSMIAMHFIITIIYIACIIRFMQRNYLWNAFISVLIIRIRVIQVSVYVELISYRFDCLNKIVKQIQDCKVHATRRLLDIDYRFIEHPDRIVAIKASYAKLYDVSNYISDDFGLSILIISTSHCLDIVCNIYWIFLTMEEILQADTLITSLMTVLSQVLLMTAFTHSCWKCIEKSNLTKNLVQKMILNYSSDHVNWLLNDFLLQMSHQPIRIHAKGFFSIDLKLLSSILVAITGYLMILLNFLITEKQA